MRVPIWLAAALLLYPSALAAQAGCSHASDDAEEDRLALAPIFYDSDPVHAAERGNAILQLTASDSSYVVQDDAVCDRVVQRAIRYLRRVDPTWRARAEGEYTADVFRFGPYYVVSISAGGPLVTYAGGVLEMQPHAGAGLTIVFRARGLKRIRSFN